MGFLFSAEYQNKKDFDISINALSKSNGYLDYQLVDNGQYEISLAKGGYFTIGTKSGELESEVDDNCSITYGHPYAKTSYPIFKIDGQWYHPEEYFIDIYPEKKTGQLAVSQLANSGIEISFSINLNENNEIALQTKMVNIDSVSHVLNSGLVLDPSLGKGGDGKIKTGDGFLSMKSMLDSKSSLQVWEKSKGAKGLGIDINAVNSEFEKIIVDNWQFAYDNIQPELSHNNIEKLFDVLNKFYWSEQEVAPGDSLVNTMTISFPAADFNSAIFTRWDMPFFFDINNGAMFPRSFNTYFELTKNGNSVDDAAIINLEMPDQIETESQKDTVDFAGKNIINEKINVSSKIIYEDKVVNLTSKISSNGKIVDQLSRNILVPETPTCDTGLTVSGDSLVTSEFPEMSLIFNVENNSTGRKIQNLRKENIFLYENETRKEDFELGLSEVEGSNLADIVFVLDCSFSMGNEINAVKDNINEFAEALVDKGYNFQIGVITFSTEVDDIWDFTKDLDEIKNNLSSVELWGGEEDSPSAIMRASELSWRNRSKRTIVWITDEPYPEDNYAAEEVVNKMLEMGITVHGVGLNHLKTDWFNPIVNPTGGNFYDINGEFRTILMDVANMGYDFKYKITYNSIFPNNDENKICLELRYNGLGTQTDFYYDVPEQAPSNDQFLSFYPNPFNERINFELNIRNFKNTKICIYNLLGEKIQDFKLSRQPNEYTFYWNGKNMKGNDVAAGMYIVKISGLNEVGEKYTKTRKILYLK